MPEPPKGRPPLVERAASHHGDRGEVRRRTAPQGVPAFVDPASEPTAVGTDAQVFRSIKALHTRIDESERKAAAAHGELTMKVEKIDEKQDQQSEMLHKVVGYIEGQRDARSKSPSSIRRAASDAARETLAEQVLADAADARKVKRRFWSRLALAVIGAATSGAFMHWLLEKL